MATDTRILSTTSRSAIVAAFTNAMDSVENTGNIIHTVCKTLNRTISADKLPKADIDDVVDAVAKARGWKDKALATRSSEVRVILRTHRELPEVLENIARKTKRCNWHVVLKAARRIAKGESMREAVAYATTEGEGAVVHPSKRAAGALKAWHKMAKAKRADIERACKLLGLVIEFDK